MQNPGRLVRPLGRSADWLALGFVVVALSILWYRFHPDPTEGLFGRRSDLVDYYYPITRLAAERLAAGELPLWNPLLCSGIPLLATLQVGVFYPPMWLSVWLPGFEGLYFRVFLETILAGVGMALALRAGGISHVGSSLGGILYVSGCVLGVSFWPPQVSTLLWLPWLLLCIEKLLDSWRWRWWIGLALATALQALSGFPQYAVYSFFLLGPYALGRVLDQREARATKWKTLLAQSGGVAAGLILGVALSGVQLVPTAELVQRSIRSGQLDPGEVLYLPGMSVPDFASNLIDPSEKPVWLDMGGGYLGIAAVVFAAIGLTATLRSPTTWLMVAVGGTALLISDGPGTRAAWLRDLYQWIPLADTFRTPQRLRFLFLAALVLLAARGFDQLGRHDAPRLRLGAAAVAAAIVVLVLGDNAARLRLGMTMALLVPLFAVPGAAYLRSGVKALLALLVVGDLWLATAGWGIYRSFREGTAEHYRTRWLQTQAEPEGGFHRGAVLGFPPRTPIDWLRERSGITCYEPLAPEPWPELSFMLRRTTRGARMEDIDPIAFPAVYDVTSVTEIWKRDGRYRRNLDALPRAYWIERYAVMQHRQILAHIRDATFDFQGSVALEADPGIPSTADPSRVRAARVTHYRPEEVRIAVAPTQASILVLTDTAYPGWTAHVDGEPAPILRANGAFRAVVIPAGAAEVVFAYRPASLRWGAAVSLSAATTIAVVATTGVVRRRSSKKSAE